MADGPTIVNASHRDGFRTATTALLENAGFHVVEARTGTEALQQAQGCLPALLLMECDLPCLEGFELCRHIRSDLRLASIKVIQTSLSDPSRTMEARSLAEGADAYLPAALFVDRLPAEIHSLLRLHEVEGELQRTATCLAEADQRKDEFLAMLGHELRNPLSAISSALPMLERGESREPREKRALDVIHRQLTHLSRLIDDLLDVARVTQGRIDLQREPVDLTALLARVAAQMEATRAAPKQQTVTVQVPGTPLWVMGDAVRLEQIVSNLLDNARKYSPPNGRIVLSLALPDATDEMVRITVKDEGLGIAPQLLPTIFGLFSQANVTLDRSRGGLGIGLTLVHTLVKLHGGTVAAHSQGEGHGSEFVVRLPALPEAHPLPTPAPVPERAPAAHRRLLIIEDNLDAQQSLADLCELMGHEVATASDGYEGIKKVVEFQPEMILLDIGLPGIDGYEVARRIRKLSGGDRFCLVALSGYGLPEQQEQSRQAGFDLHLIKPIRMERLSYLLERPPEAGMAWR